MSIAPLVAAGCGEVVSATECADTDLVCDEMCVDVNTSHDHCGACGNACGDTQACVAGACEPLDAVVAAIEQRWHNPTGWMAANGQPIEMTFQSAGIPGATYMCRTAHVSMIGATDFTPCDGGDGTTPVHRPTPTANMEQGNYRTEVRIQVGDWQSDTVTYDYYAHASLDGAQACEAPFTDQEIFEVARQQLDTSVTFPADTRLRNPFIRVPFTDVIITPGMINGSPNKWSNVQDYLVEVNSLRRRFTLNPEHTLLLVQRQYASRRAVAFNETDAMCDNGFYFGSPNPSFKGSPQRSKVDCQNFVLNARGQAVCLIQNPDNPAELITRLTSMTGFVKLQKHGSFSAKGPEATCPADLQEACTWYLELPQ